MGVDKGPIRPLGGVVGWWDSGCGGRLGEVDGVGGIVVLSWMDDWVVEESDLGGVEVDIGWVPYLVT